MGGRASFEGVLFFWVMLCLSLSGWLAGSPAACARPVQMEWTSWQGALLLRDWSGPALAAAAGQAQITCLDGHVQCICDLVSRLSHGSMHSLCCPPSHLLFFKTLRVSSRVANSFKAVQYHPYIGAFTFTHNGSPAVEQTNASRIQSLNTIYLQVHHGARQQHSFGLHPGPLSFGWVYRPPKPRR